MLKFQMLLAAMVSVRGSQSNTKLDNQPENIHDIPRTELKTLLSLEVSSQNVS